MAGIPNLSIVITSYNYARFLPRAIESALGQGIEDSELLILDNCSTDDSWAVIQRFSGAYNRIRAIRNESNVGLVGNHQRGLEHARGERVLFLSADDYLLPGHAHRALAVHQAHPEIDVVIAPFFHVNEHGAVTKYFNHNGHLRGSYTGGRNEFAGLLTYDCYGCMPATLWNRKKLIDSGAFEPDLIAGDLDVYLHFAARGGFAFLDAPAACLTAHSSSASGPDRYVTTGRQFLEHLRLLEKYLTPEYEHLFRGHENGIAGLLRAKVNNALAFPDAAAIVRNERDRIDEITERLNQSLSKTLSSRVSSAPLVSVILICGDDLNAIRATICDLQKQTYSRWELIAVANSSYDVAPLLQHLGGTKIKVVSHRTPCPLAVSLNDAARMCAGEIVTYVDVATSWPNDHLERVVRGLSDSRIDAMTVPLNTETVRDGTPVASFTHFAGGSLAEVAARIGEAVPLNTIAHRRFLFDQAGAFEEGLTHLIDVEFVQRILSRGPLGVDDGEPILQTVPFGSLHPALSDPNGYMASLRAIYQGRLVDSATAHRREAHFARLSNELRALALAPDTARAHLFTSLSRGGATDTTTKRRVHKRVVVVDDCVPYTELGRGYPRARTAVENLRDEGYEVLFYPLVRPFDDPALSYGIEGVTIFYGQGPELLGLTLDAQLDNIDLLWVSRPHNMRDVQSILRVIGRPAPPIVYDAEAVYVERDRVRAALEGRPLPHEQYQEALTKELSYTDGCSVVSAVSEGERELIASRFRGPIEVLSFSIDANPTSASFDERDGILFVGAIEEDSPNDDALFFFASSVAPLLPPIALRHAGVMNSARLRNTNVQFLGVVPDLHPIYNASRIFIAPTRFAAGLPQKVYEAAAHGLPVVASSLIASQLGWIPGRDLLIADTPEEWKTAIERLNGDPVLWNALREAGLSRVRNEVSPTAFRARVAAIADRALDSTQVQVHA